MKKKFVTKDGAWVKFLFNKQKFYIQRGVGKQVKTLDHFPPNAARLIATEIMKMTNQHQKQNKVEKDLLIPDRKLKPEETRNIIKQVLEQTDHDQQTKKVHKILHSDQELQLRQPRELKVEKTREDVVQLIYEEFGEEWFSLGEFREVYHAQFERTPARRMIQVLKQNSLVNQKESGEEYTQYRVVYKLSKLSLNEINKYNGKLNSEENKVYKRKKAKIKS